MVRMEWIVSCGERVMKRFKGPLAAAATSYQSVSQGIMMMVKGWHSEVYCRCGDCCVLCIVFVVDGNLAQSF